jgi:sugar phosphate isomerase/epimerase
MNNNLEEVATISNPPTPHPKAQFTLSAFGDEISTDFAEQLAVLQQHGIAYIELRSAWGKNVANLTDQELAQIETALTKFDIKVSSIGSPIGKVPVNTPLEAELHRLERIIEIAKRLNSRYIRMFSFFLPAEPAAHPHYRDQVLFGLDKMVKLAQAHDLILLHENEKEIYGDTAAHCYDILSSIGSPHFQAVFDPANFVQCGNLPYTEAYPLIEPYLVYLHIKDARFSDGQVVVAGAGDGEWRELLSALDQKGFQGFASFEPHLTISGLYGGYSGAELFHTAVSAFNKLLTRQEVLN